MTAKFRAKWMEIIVAIFKAVPYRWSKGFDKGSRSSRRDSSLGPLDYKAGSN
jgi:hypothetical protein